MTDIQQERGITEHQNRIYWSQTERPRMYQNDTGTKDNVMKRYGMETILSVHFSTILVYSNVQ